MPDLESEGGHPEFGGYEHTHCDEANQELKKEVYFEVAMVGTCCGLIWTIIFAVFAFASLDGTKICFANSNSLKPLTYSTDAELLTIIKAVE